MTNPRSMPLSARLREHESSTAYLEYKVEALESSLRRLWAAFSDFEEKMEIKMDYAQDWWEDIRNHLDLK